MPNTNKSIEPPLATCNPKRYDMRVMGRGGSISRAKGQQYEMRAAAFLQQKGWEILRRNYHSRYGEIDIIALRECELAFIEVKGRKYRTSWNEDAIPFSKRRKIVQTAEYYLQHEDVEYVSLQFGVVLIEGDDIHLMENAFGVE